MNIFKYFVLLLSLFNCISAMEQPKVVSEKTETVKFSSLPLDVWNTIIQRHLIDEEAETEKEIFQNMDNLRILSKNSKNVIDSLVQKVGQSKNKPNYTYAEFKADIMNDIINQVAKNYLGDKIYAVMILNADNWFKYYRSQKLQDKIDETLNSQIKIENNYSYNLNGIKFLLKSGANPNKSNPGDKEYPLFLMRPMIAFMRFSPFNKDNNQSRINLIKILLEYGANPNLKDDKYNFSPIEYAKFLIERNQQGYLSKKIDDVTYKIIDENLKEIVKLFEDAIEKRKQEELKKK